MSLFTLSTTHWFLPAGLRVAALWMTPRRYWPALALAEWIGIAAVSSVDPQHHHALPALLATTLPWLAYAFATHEVKRIAHTSLTEAVAYDAPLAMFAGLVGASINAFTLTAAGWLDQSTMLQPLGTLFGFALGDYLGVLAVAPMAVLLRTDWRKRAEAALYHANGWVVVPMAGVMATLWAGGLFPREYHWFFVSTPLLALGVVAGRRVAVVGVTVLAWFYVLAAHADSHFWSPVEVQRILAIAGSAAMLLGARRDAMHQQRHRLSSSIEELQLKTQALRDAATRLSTQREAESRALGLELHDEVGQDMTALATRLHLAERSAQSDAMREELRGLQQMVVEAHDHLRSVIRHLHPIALERFGLERALCAGPLAEIADDAGISYHCDLHGPVASLRLDMATAVYRICQEAVTNAVRHGCGGHLTVRLVVGLPGYTNCIELSISDMAGVIRVPPGTSGLGLQGIRDRANALGADYRFNPSSGQPRHWLRMSVPGNGLPPDAHTGGRRHGDRPGGDHGGIATSLALRFARMTRA